MSSSTPTDLVVNHHLQGDDDFVVLATGAPLTPDKMVELREAAKLLNPKE